MAIHYRGWPTPVQDEFLREVALEDRRKTRIFRDQTTLHDRRNTHRRDRQFRLAIRGDTSALLREFCSSMQSRSKVPSGNRIAAAPRSGVAGRWKPRVTICHDFGVAVERHPRGLGARKMDAWLGLEALRFEGCSTPMRASFHVLRTFQRRRTAQDPIKISYATFPTRWSARMATTVRSSHRRHQLRRIER